MTVSLQKGERVRLEKLAEGLSKITIGLGWSPAQTGKAFDLDASAILLNSGKVRRDSDFVFYGNLATEAGAVTHTGDNLTGDGDGDDEQIIVDLSKIPSDVDKIVFPVSIYQARERQQNFGQVNDAYIRIINNADNKEVAKFDLTEDSSTASAMMFGELYKRDGEWRFVGTGTPVEGGLSVVAKNLGVNIA